MSYGSKPRRISGKQKVYIKDLIKRVGEQKAAELAAEVLDVNIFAPVDGQYEWQKETELDYITSAQATDLINALKEAK